MTILKTAYDTFIGTPMVPTLTRAEHACEDAQLASNYLTNNYNEYAGDGLPTDKAFIGGLVTHGSPAEAMVVPFVYPMMIVDPSSLSSRDGIKRIVVGDARPFMRAARGPGERPSVVNRMEFELLRVNLAATLHWLNEGPQHLMSISPVMAQVYCRWIADSISRRFELDMTQRSTARVLAAYFFQCCFTNEKEVGETQHRAMAAQACRAAGVPVVEFESTLKDIGVITSAADFVQVLRKSLDTPRLDGFNIGILATIIMGTWFGFNGRELASAAIEHPPTFAAMLYMSFAQNGYRKSGLAMVSEAYKGQKGGSEFVRNMQLQLKLQ